VRENDFTVNSRMRVMFLESGSDALIM